MKTIMECFKAWKIYNEGKPNQVNAISNIDLKINKGDFISVTGPSGCGKSTLLNLIGCLDKPTRGSIFIEGKDVSKMNKNDLAEIRKSKIGFVFQSFNLIHSFTAEENVELPTLFGLYSLKVRKNVRKLLKRLGLAERLKHMPSELSIGQIQKVAIARALINNPAIILADEPTGNLDSASGKEIMKIFTELNKEGKTIVAVTHDPNIAMVAKRVIHMKDGQILHF